MEASAVLSVRINDYSSVTTEEEREEDVPQEVNETPVRPRVSPQSRRRPSKTQQVDSSLLTLAQQFKDLAEAYEIGVER